MLWFLLLENENVISKLIFLVAIIVFTKLAHVCHFLHQSAQRKKRLPFENIPYTVPDPHWYLGHAPLLRSIQGQRTLCVDHAGPTGVSTFWVMQVPVISFLRAKDADRVLRHTHERIQLPAFLKHTTKLLGKTSLITARGNEWKTNRSIVHRAFLPRALEDATKSIAQTCVRVVQSILASMDKSGRLVINIVKLAKMTTLDTFGMAALGHDFECTANDQLTESPVYQSQDFFLQELARRNHQQRFHVAAQYYWVPSPKNYEYHTRLGEMRKLLLSIVQRRRRQVMKDEHNKQVQGNLLDHLLRGSTRSDGKVNLSNEFLSDFLNTLLLGGYETTSLTLSYTLYLLARFPRAQQACVEEVKRVLGPFPLLPPENFQPERDLPYSCAVITESLRLYPPTFATARTLDRSLEMKIDNDSVELPVNTRVYIPFWWIHRSSENFARPNEFLPERWVRQRENGTWEGRSDSEEEPVPADNPKHVLSFSSGARSCVGRPFAMRQIPTILAFLIRSFRVTLENPDQELEVERKGLTISPKGPIPMVLQKREMSNNRED